MLQRIYPDNLCVSIEYEMGFVVINAPPKKGGAFVTCRVTGVGDYDIVEATETIAIGIQSYSVRGNRVYERDAAATFRDEFSFVYLEHGTTINDGGYWKYHEAAYEDCLPVKQTALQILASYQQTSREQSCASGWSRLYPGIFAVVTDGPNNPPNRVRSLPDTTSQVVARLRPVQTAVILAGPTCADGLIFWKAQSDAIPGG